MVWLHPAAAIALAALAVPILVHILVRQRAERLPFPTLRFIQPHRLASIRRRALDDAALLAVRALIFIAAVAAIAGPFLVTAARRRAWDARTVRVEVGGDDLRGGLVRALASLDRQPPGRREIVVRSTFPIGSIASPDIAAIPSSVGLRFERLGQLPASRTVPIGSVVEAQSAIDREATLDADRTSVRDVRSAPATGASPFARWLAEERVPAPVPGRSAQLVFGSAGVTTTPVAPITMSWMADAAATIQRNLPRTPVTFGADGGTLIVRPGVSDDDPQAQLVARAVAGALAPTIEHPDAEIVSISDAQLRVWARDAGPAQPPAPESLERDDRRWLWGLVLALLAAEQYLRRSRAAIEKGTVGRAA